MSDDVGGRKFSLGSATDQGKVSFANKAVEAQGETGDGSIPGFGFTCRKGLKPEAPNQDSWTIIKVDNFSIYGVFDGHGQKGHDVSNFVKDSLPKIIVKDQRFRTDQMPTMLIEAFKKTQSLVATADRMKKLSAQMSGTTATVVIHELSAGEASFGKLTVAHVADSTAVLGKVIDGKVQGAPLTRDHKPDLKDERQRIEKNGGRVVFDGYANHRVYAKNARYPGLNMSRCIGDLLGHQDCGITAEPEVKVLDLVKEDSILLLCSDGVWEFITPQDAVNKTITKDGKPTKNTPQATADQLAKESWDSWIREEGGAVVDDITVVLMYLHVINQAQNQS